MDRDDVSIASAPGTTVGDGHDVPALLWKNRDVFPVRHEKSADALVALQRALTRDHPLGGQEEEFLALYGALREMDAEIFTAVWSDPYAYFWVRIAFELLAGISEPQALQRLAGDYVAAIHEPDAGKALGSHLGDFKRIMLGAYALSMQDIRFDEPLTADLPLAIPGTPYCLVGEGRVEIEGVLDRQVCAVYDGKPLSLPLEQQAVGPAALSIQSCPVIRYHGCEIRLQPAAYNLSALDFRELVVAAGIDYQRDHKTVMEPALKALEAHAPDVFGQFSEFIQVMALKPDDPGTYRDNLSHSDLPGAIVARPIANPYYFAHVFVHEFHHNRLFCIEEQGRILEDSDESLERAQKFYSPWRVDARPMHGIVHALYVTIAVVRFWLSVYREEDLDEVNRGMAVDQFLYGIQQMRIAAFQIGRHASLTPFGRNLFEQMRKDVAALQHEAEQLPVPAKVAHTLCKPDGAVERIAGDAGWQTVEQAITEHIAAYAGEEAKAVLAHLAVSH